MEQIVSLTMCLEMDVLTQVHGIASGLVSLQQSQVTKISRTSDSVKRKLWKSERNGIVKSQMVLWSHSIIWMGGAHSEGHKNGIKIRTVKGTILHLIWLTSRVSNIPQIIKIVKLKVIPVKKFLSV